MIENEGRQDGFLCELVARGEWEQAFATLNRAIEESLEPELLYRERAHMHLYLGQTQQARSDFDITARLGAEERRTRPGRLHANTEYDAIGVTYWMEEHRELALAFWRYTTRMLAANHVSYAGTGGGVESGLLLWFAAVHERNADDVALVRRLYEQRLTSTFWSHNLTRWPGPIVRFFLEQSDEHDLIERAADDGQALCQAHFALAVRARELGRHRAYRKHLELAAPENGPQDLYDFYNVFPYFLARSELAKRSK